MKNKLLTIMLLLTLAMSMGACGANSEANTQDGQSAEDQTEDSAEGVIEESVKAEDDTGMENIKYLTCSVEDLIAGLADGEEAANETYMNQHVELTGIYGGYQADTSSEVTMEWFTLNSTDGSDGEIKCYHLVYELPYDTLEEAVQGIEVGDTVTIKGQICGVSADWGYMVDIIEIEE